MKRELLCISCPIGCSMEAEFDDNKILKLEGYQCKRGITYAEKEIFNPERMVTTTVRIEGGEIPLIPVKTESSVPKELALKVVQEASKITVKAPVKVGDVIIENILGTGVNLVATRNVKATCKAGV
ncbi:MAG: hypothetical protein DRP87_15050 [Spirochaetes bacterium]|nr:MAG: hypothetical protein DRP87_15050 [Spirochaetota bacterium]